MQLAAADIVIAWATILWCVIAVWPVYKWIAVVQVPYFVWVAIRGDSEYEAFDVFLPLIHPHRGGPLKLLVRNLVTVTRNSCRPAFEYVVQDRMKAAGAQLVGPYRGPSRSEDAVLASAKARQSAVPKWYSWISACPA